MSAAAKLESPRGGRDLPDSARPVAVAGTRATRDARLCPLLLLLVSACAGAGCTDAPRLGDAGGGGASREAADAALVSMERDLRSRDASPNAAPPPASLRMDDGAMDLAPPFFTRTGMRDQVAPRIRNDRTPASAHTEIALLYAAVRGHDGTRAVVPVIDPDAPAHERADDLYKLLGLSTAWSTPAFALSQPLEVRFRDDSLQEGGALERSGGVRFFPVVELKGEAAQVSRPQNSVLAGVKYRLGGSVLVGFGYEVPTTVEREFEHQLLLQFDIDW